MSTYLGTGPLVTSYGPDPNNENVTKIGVANLQDQQRTLDVPGLLEAGRFEGGVTVDLTAGAATKFLSIALAQGSGIGLMVNYRIYATDGTDFQVRSGRVYISAVNKAGTVTGVASVAGTEAFAESAGASTLTNTFTAVEGTADVLDLKANAASSLTETTLNITFTVEVLGTAPVITAA